MIGVAKLRCGDRSSIAIVDGVMTVVPKVIKVRRVGKVLRNRKGITVLGVGSVVVVDLIRKAVVIEAILPGIGGTPSCGREGEAGMVMVGVRMVGGRDGISGWVVTDRLRRLLVWIIDYAGTVEELSLGSITSSIVLIGGMRVGRGIEGGCGKGEV